MTQVCGFFVQEIEYERGWGSRPDGYSIFETEELATRFISDRLAERHKDYVPDWYMDYRKVGWQPITHAEAAMLTAKGIAHRN